MQPAYGIFAADLAGELLDHDFVLLANGGAVGGGDFSDEDVFVFAAVGDGHGSIAGTDLNFVGMGGGEKVQNGVELVFGNECADAFESDAGNFGVFGFRGKFDEFSGGFRVFAQPDDIAEDFLFLEFGEVRFGYFCDDALVDVVSFRSFGELKDAEEAFDFAEGCCGISDDGKDSVELWFGEGDFFGVGIFGEGDEGIEFFGKAAFFEFRGEEEAEQGDGGDDGGEQSEFGRCAHFFALGCDDDGGRCFHNGGGSGIERSVNAGFGAFGGNQGLGCGGGGSGGTSGGYGVGHDGRGDGFAGIRIASDALGDGAGIGRDA